MTGPPEGPARTPEAFELRAQIGGDSGCPRSDVRLLAGVDVEVEEHAAPPQPIDVQGVGAMADGTDGIGLRVVVVGFAREIALAELRAAASPGRRQVRTVEPRRRRRAGGSENGRHDVHEGSGRRDADAGRHAGPAHEQWHPHELLELCSAVQHPAVLEELVVRDPT